MQVGMEALIRAAERPCRIEDALFARPTKAGETWLRSYLKSPRLPVTHIEHCFGRYFEKLTPVPSERASNYNNCLHWPEGYPPGAQELISLLEEVLALPTGDDRLDLALALDWYKVVDSTVAPTEWENTEAGDLVSKMKYWVNKPTIRQASADRLVELLSAAVGRHPALRDASSIVSAPGSKGDGSSVGEYIAGRVAERTGKTLIMTAGPAREPRKAGGATGSLDGHFTLPATIGGACVIVDDVFRSGMTMRATALAARRAGATAVYGLAAAKTISG